MIRYSPVVLLNEDQPCDGCPFFTFCTQCRQELSLNEFPNFHAMVEVFYKESPTIRFRHAYAQRIYNQAFYYVSNTSMMNCFPNSVLDLFRPVNVPSHYTTRDFLFSRMNYKQLKSITETHTDPTNFIFSGKK